MSGLFKKISKLILTLVGVTLLFIVVVTGIFIATFDANQYKQELSDLVRDETGRELEFFGDVSLTIYPALGMKLGALSFSNATGFGAQPMVKVNKVSVSVDVASLLTFSPEINQLQLEDLEVNLQKNARGQTNWDDLVQPASAPATTTTTEGASDEAPLSIAGAFGGLNIQNASILWNDAQAGVEYRVHDLDLVTGRISQDTPFPLHLKVALQDKAGLDARLELNAEVLYLLNQQRLTITDLKLDASAQGKQLPLGQIALGVASKTASLDIKRNALKLDGLVLAVDDARLSGNIDVSDYTKPALKFNLASDKLDIDALLGIPPVDKNAPAAAEVPASDAPADDVQISLPMELLRSLQLDGQLAVKQIKLMNMHYSDLSLVMKANKGLLAMAPMKMNLYEGSFEGEVQIDATGFEPKYHVVKHLNGVKVGLLMADFLGEKRISGALVANVEMTTRGEWLSALKKNSNGTMNLAFEDGAIKGFNLRYLVEKAKAKFNKQPPPPETEQKTDFSALTLSGVVTNGVFSSKDLNLQAPLVRVTGEGKADLNDNTVDYLVNAKLVATTSGQQGGTADELSGLLIPVSIKGPFNAPKINILLDDMLKARANAASKAAIDQQKALLQQQIDAEKAALEAAKQAEIAKQKAVLDAKKAAASDKAKNKLLDLIK